VRTIPAGVGGKRRRKAPSNGKRFPSRDDEYGIHKLGANPGLGRPMVARGETLSLGDSLEFSAVVETIGDQRRAAE